MIVLTVEAQPGDSDHEAATQAQRIADILQVVVKFKFNGCTCLSVPGGDPALLCERRRRDPGGYASSKP